jgi:hypothetical protein
MSHKREQLQSFPSSPTEEDIITFFNLTRQDLAIINKRTGDYNRLGFALQLCTLRYLGFIPDELQKAPSAIVDYLASQLMVDSSVLPLYGKREKTRTNQLQEIQAYLGWRKPTQMDFLLWDSWLLDRAMELTVPVYYFNYSVINFEGKRLFVLE